MECDDVPTAGGRTGSWGRDHRVDVVGRCRCPLVAFRAWPDPVTT